MTDEEVAAAKAELGWRWPVQQALWNLVREGDVTTWTDAVALTEEVCGGIARVLVGVTVGD